jgi:RNA polymerase sigma factor (TIGR02999 family)
MCVRPAKFPWLDFEFSSCSDAAQGGGLVIGGEITLLLERVRNGDRQAFEGLAHATERRLRLLAGNKMRIERPGHLLQVTALVNETFLRLMRSNVLLKSPNRRYLFAAASRAMRRILVEHARKKRAELRADVQHHVVLRDLIERTEYDGARLVELNEAIEELRRFHARQAAVVHLRYFAGCSIREASEALGVSEWTVENDFRIARAWLRAKLDNSF